LSKRIDVTKGEERRFSGYSLGKAAQAHRRLARQHVLGRMVPADSRDDRTMALLL
jgi:hypothetical protein